MANVFTSLGSTIPVTGPYVGFPGTVSRAGERVIVSRPLAGPSNLNFGDLAVLVGDSTGGKWQSVADFLATATNIPLLGALIGNPGSALGIAVREVKTMLTYPAGQTPGLAQVGYYAAGEEADVLEMGSITVNMPVGTPIAGGPVYCRLVANSATTGSAVGDLEAAPEVVSNLTATDSSGATVTPVNMTGIKVGQIITAASGVIPAGTYVSAVGASTITISQAVTAALTGAVTFSNTVALPDFVFRTGYLDGSGVAEITILRRRGA